MNKKILILIAMLLIVPIVIAAVDETKPAIDLYYLFVENTFGGVFLSAIGLGALFYFIGMISKMSRHLLHSIIITFWAALGIGYVGGLAIFLIGIFAIFYGVVGFIEFITSKF